MTTCGSGYVSSSSPVISYCDADKRFRHTAINIMIDFASCLLQLDDEAFRVAVGLHKDDLRRIYEKYCCVPNTKIPSE